MYAGRTENPPKCPGEDRRPSKRALVRHRRPEALGARVSRVRRGAELGPLLLQHARTRTVPPTGRAAGAGTARRRRHVARAGAARRRRHVARARKAPSGPRSRHPSPRAVFRAFGVAASPGMSIRWAWYVNTSLFSAFCPFYRILLERRLGGRLHGRRHHRRAHWRRGGVCCCSCVSSGRGGIGASRAGSGSVTLDEVDELERWRSKTDNIFGV